MTQNFDPKQAASDVRDLKVQLTMLTDQVKAIVENHLSDLHGRLLELENKMVPVIRHFGGDVAGQGEATIPAPSAADIKTGVAPVDASTVGKYGE